MRRAVSSRRRPRRNASTPNWCRRLPMPDILSPAFKDPFWYRGLTQDWPAAYGGVRQTYKDSKAATPGHYYRYRRGDFNVWMQLAGAPGPARASRIRRAGPYPNANGESRRRLPPGSSPLRQWRRSCQQLTPNRRKVPRRSLKIPISTCAPIRCKMRSG